MSFSMDQIKSTSKRKVNKIKTNDVFGWVVSLTNISDDTKLVIQKYLQVRFRSFGPHHLNMEQYKFMIKELLKNCCGKEFIYITPQDTENNITEIAFQLKWSLERCNKDKRKLYSKNIFVDRNKELTLAKYENSKPPKRIKFNKISEEALDEYMKGWVWNNE